MNSGTNDMMAGTAVGNGFFPAMFSPVLARLSVDAASHFGSDGLKLQPVGYEERPFTHLLRVSVTQPQRQDPLSFLFVKILKPRDIGGGPEALRHRLVRDYEATRRVYKAFASHPDLGVVPPVACYPEQLAIATEAVAGPTLLSHLESESAWFPGHDRVAALKQRLASVGRWLKVFQSSAPCGEPLTIEFLRSYVDHRLVRLERQHVFTHAFRQKLLRRIEQLGEGVRPSELQTVCIHADFALGNIIVSDSRIIVLDFEMTASGTALHDLTRVFLQLEMLAVKPHIRTALIHELQTALLGGYDPAVRASGALFRILMLLHRINNVGTLALGRRPFPESIYNRFVIRHQVCALHAELGSAVVDTGAAS